MHSNIRWGFKKAYKECGFTLDELSSRSGITRSYLSLFSNGRMNLSPDQIKTLSMLLDVPVGQIRD